MDFVFEKMDLLAALQVVSWEYPAPYEVYNLHGSALALARLVDGAYFSVFSQEQLVGFFCFGSAAQLAGKRDHRLYQDKAYLDVGLGMHPHRCDRGLGSSFVRAGLVYARKQDWRGGFRLTVASNNLRAYKVYSRLGFQEEGRIVWNPKLRSDFVVMTLDTFELSPPASPGD